MNYGDKIYYRDELNDEVVNFAIKKRKVDKKYKYIHKNIFYKLWAFITYRFFATPYAWFHFKFIRRTKYVNKHLLKKAKKQSYFVYSNHVDQISDGFSPTNICFPKKPYLIVNSDNISMHILGRLTPMWGALPLPDTIDATRNFNKAIEHIIKKKNPIVIYPEAHLWPFYTKIRPYDSKSFRFPAKYNLPIFVFTTTFQMKKMGKKPKTTIYIDGPFYPDESLDLKSKQQALRDIAYKTMCDRARLSDYEYVTYIKENEN